MDKGFADSIFETASLRDIENLVAGGMGQTIGGVECLVVPSGYQLVVPDVEAHLPQPSRKKGLVTLTEVISFIDYLKGHKEAGTEVFADSNGHTLTARINGHSPAGAGWGDHRAIFSMRFTPAWTAWTGFADKMMPQVTFAQFLEDRIGEIADPPGAELFEMVRALRIHVNAVWENIVNTQHNGMQFRWQEEVTTGDVIIPEKLALMIAPFDGSDKVLVTARLRFAKPDSNGKVSFYYTLGEETRRILDDTFTDICKEVSKEAGVPIYRGTFRDA